MLIFFAILACIGDVVEDDSSGKDDTGDTQDTESEDTGDTAA